MLSTGFPDSYPLIYLHNYSYPQSCAQFFLKNPIFVKNRFHRFKVTYAIFELSQKMR